MQVKSIFSMLTATFFLLSLLMPSVTEKFAKAEDPTSSIGLHYAQKHGYNVPTVAGNY